MKNIILKTMGKRSGPLVERIFIGLSYSRDLLLEHKHDPQNYMITAELLQQYEILINNFKALSRDVNGMMTLGISHSYVNSLQKDREIIAHARDGAVLLLERHMPSEKTIVNPLQSYFDSHFAKILAIISLQFDPSIYQIEIVESEIGLPSISKLSKAISSQLPSSSNPYEALIKNIAVEIFMARHMLETYSEIPHVYALASCAFQSAYQQYANYFHAAPSHARAEERVAVNDALYQRWMIESRNALAHMKNPAWRNNIEMQTSILSSIKGVCDSLMMLNARLNYEVVSIASKKQTDIAHQSLASDMPVVEEKKVTKNNTKHKKKKGSPKQREDSGGFDDDLSEDALLERLIAENQALKNRGEKDITEKKKEKITIAKFKMQKLDISLQDAKKNSELTLQQTKAKYKISTALSVIFLNIIGLQKMIKLFRVADSEDDIWLMPIDNTSNSLFQCNIKTSIGMILSHLPQAIMDGIITPNILYLGAAGQTELKALIDKIINSFGVIEARLKLTSREGVHQCIKSLSEINLELLRQGSVDINQQLFLGKSCKIHIPHHRDYCDLSLDQKEILKICNPNLFMVVSWRQFDQFLDESENDMSWLYSRTMSSCITHWLSREHLSDPEIMSKCILQSNQESIIILFAKCFLESFAVESTLLSDFFKIYSEIYGYKDLKSLFDLLYIRGKFQYSSEIEEELRENIYLRGELTNPSLKGFYSPYEYLAYKFAEIIFYEPPEVKFPDENPTAEMYKARDCFMETLRCKILDKIQKYLEVEKVLEGWRSESGDIIVKMKIIQDLEENDMAFGNPQDRFLRFAKYITQDAMRQDTENPAAILQLLHNFDKALYQKEINILGFSHPVDLD